MAKKPKTKRVQRTKIAPRFQFNSRVATTMTPTGEQVLLVDEDGELWRWYGTGKILRVKS